MLDKFSPSVNIIRDNNRDIYYIPTTNSSRLFDQIVKEFNSGIHTFNIIGSYGTGKSSFLLELMKFFSNKNSAFGKFNGQFQGITNFEIKNIIGEYNSIIKSISKTFKLSAKHSTQDIILKLEKNYKKYYQNQFCLVIIIDEFGKYLEYVSKNNPEDELFFIQQLAEFANDTTKNILLITTLHQDFSSYAYNLNRTQRQEWDKVKGRLKEIPFNEPVEQLIFLASEHKTLNRYTHYDGNSFNKLNTLIISSKATPFLKTLSNEIAKKLLPLDLLASSVLTIALQRYGQNERSLFTFLESHDVHGIKEYDFKNNPYYNVSCVYDYLINNYYSYLTTLYNPDNIQWSSIRNAIERIEYSFVKNIENAKKIVKTIGLLNILFHEALFFNLNFLQKYSLLSMGIDNAKNIIKELESKKIIRYINYKNKFILFEGTDFDFKTEFRRASQKVEQVEDVPHHLIKYFHFPVFPAKAVFFKKGTPRFVKFEITDQPSENIPKGEIDLIINLIFNEEIKPANLKNPTLRHRDDILYCLYKNTKEIKNKLREIEIDKYVLESIVEDRIAKREVKNILDYHIEELNHHVLTYLYKSNAVFWIYNGKEIIINNEKDLNKKVSKICDEIYTDVPTFKNELINRQKFPPPITIARKKFFSALLTNSENDDIGFPNDKFPPEKTIYFTLLKNTGIHYKDNGTFSFNKPANQSFKSLWNTSEDFINGAKLNRRNISEFFDILLTKPFKLKKGFLDFWIPTFLIIKKEDYALFYENIFMSDINIEIIDLLLKKPEAFQIKTFDVEGLRLNLFNKYRQITDKDHKESISKAAFIETVKPFLIFYKGLPDYSKNTKRLSSDALTVRDIIAIAKDPEELFFEDFPKGLGYDVEELIQKPNILEEYVKKLKETIKEIRLSYEELINRIVEKICKIICNKNLEFNELKLQIRERYSSLKDYLLLPYQKIFYIRLVSDLKDEKSWMNSVSQSVLKKPLEQIRDEDEEVLHEELSKMFHELDNLCDISKLKVDSETEELLKFEISTLSGIDAEEIVRYPKSKNREILHLESNIRKILVQDNTINRAALIKTLKQIKKKNE